MSGALACDAHVATAGSPENRAKSTTPTRSPRRPQLCGGSLGFRDWRLEVWVSGLGLGASDLGFSVHPGVRKSVLGFWVYDLGFGIWDLGFGIRGLGSGFWGRVQDLKCGV